MYKMLLYTNKLKDLVMADNKHRVNIVLNDSLNAKLEELAKSDGTTKTQIIKKALQLLDIVKKQENMKNTMAFVDSDDIIKQKVVGI